MPFNFDYDMIFSESVTEMEICFEEKRIDFYCRDPDSGGVLWLGFQIAGKRSHNTIRITVDGKEFGTYSLSQDQIIHIGDTNVCEIKDEKLQ